MHIGQAAFLGAAVSLIANAGPALACHDWASTSGSVFEALGSLRDQAMFADDSPAHSKAARAKIAALRAEIRPDEPLTLLKAGYWIAVLHDIGVAPDSDGVDLIRRAAELRPDDAEYQFFLALAFFDTDAEQYQKHWARARQLAKSGSLAARNMADFEPVLLARRQALGR